MEVKKNQGFEKLGFHSVNLQCEIFLLLVLPHTISSEELNFG